MTPVQPAHDPKSLPELLAPAGSPEAFRAAVAAGADAIYLSGKKFGARKFAGNFTKDEIEQAVNYAHRRGVRVYVTVNTAMHDRELGEAVSYLIWLYSVGVDAVLVQDIGLAALAREIVPGLPLHASTQMTIHTAEGVRWAAEQGFTRVVLARELPLSAARKIAEQTAGVNVGLEVFAHGALCYCYSGQCLFSSYIGGRSGNRGMCAQPCRRLYMFVTGDVDAYGRPARLQEHPSPARYLLSPKDLSTYRHLDELARSPLVSLKIEGRMRSPEYVAIVVSTYRRALDVIALGSFAPSAADESDLLLAFNRGFTAGYLFDERGDRIMGRDAPDNRGVPIGMVTEYDARTRTVSVKLTGTIVPESGDGLLITSPGPETGESGFSLNNAPAPGKKGYVSFLVPSPVKPGSVVFVTFSRRLDARARRTIDHPDCDLRHPVPLDITATISPEGNMYLEGTLRSSRGDKIRFRFAPELKFAPAKSRPLSCDQVREQLGKTGGTPFVVRSLVLEYDGTLFAPVAALNKVRRDFLLMAEELMVTSCQPRHEEVAEIERKWQDYPAGKIQGTAGMEKTGQPAPYLCIYADTVNSVRSSVLAGCNTVCYEPGFARGCGSAEAEFFHRVEQEITEVAGICHDAGVSFTWKFPRIVSDEYLAAILPVVRNLTDNGTKRRINRFMVDDVGTARFLLHIVPYAEIFGSTGLNTFNHAGAAALSPLFRELTLSTELSGDEIAELIKTAKSGGNCPGFAVIVQGSGEMMVSEDCLAGTGKRSRAHTPGSDDRTFSGILDGTGHLFPVITDSDCRTHILNAAETCLIDHLPALAGMGVDELVIDARGRTPEYAAEITRIYREAMGLALAGTGMNIHDLDRLKGDVKRISLGGITAGHFIRGLKE